MAKRQARQEPVDDQVTERTGTGIGSPPGSDPGSPERRGATRTENQTERLRRRAAFLRDLAEAKELRARVRPRRTRLARLRDALRQATYRAS
jgi:hypothetical protein